MNIDVPYEDKMKRTKTPFDVILESMYPAKSDGPLMVNASLNCFSPAILSFI